jgi:beta-lactam-binding protein with PASTA domain
MKLPVGITPNTTSVTCARGNQAECAFEVKNISDTTLRVGFDTVGLPAERRWTSIAEDVAIKLPAQALEKIKGLPLPDAVAVLTKVGLSHGATTTQITGVARLTVLDHKPAGGDTAEAGATFDLVVEGESVRVPSVLNRSLQQATTALVAAGLKVAGIRSVDPEGGAAVCTIKSQEPAPGAFAPPGSDAKLVVRRIQVRFKVPVLFSKTRERVFNVDCR